MNYFESVIPDNRVSIAALQRETQLSSTMLSVYRTIFGLHSIPVWNDSPELFISAALEKLIQKINHFNDIKYVIHLHTAQWPFPFGDHVITRIKKKYGFESAMSWGSTQYKCVSYFKTLELLSMLLENKKNISAIVLTGEVAFTSKLRVVPRSTIVGDAATAALFSFSGEGHALLSVTNKLLPGYAKGIDLLDSELQHFDTHFISEMTQVIRQALLKANVTLNQIKLILPHNVNIPTWKKISEALQFPLSKIYLNNITELGHCFCSDHLINLQSALHDQLLEKNDYYLMAGCGLGFYFSAAVFRY